MHYKDISSHLLIVPLASSNYGLSAQDFQLLLTVCYHVKCNMARNNRTTTHTINSLTAHLVWITKYRYAVLTGEVALRARDLIRQICDANDIYIIKGVVSKDHIHLHISYPPKLAISEIVRRLKGRSGRKLLMESPHLKKRYWGGHIWAIGYGVWSTGNITDEIINAYLENHRQKPNIDDKTFILR